jgi:glutamate dehydrogenase
MTAEVCGLVLADNRQQTQLISIEERVSREDLGDMAVLAAELFEAKLLDPKLERFPDAAELRRRGERRAGLVRHELAQLVAFTKIDLFRALVETRLAETAGFEEYLLGYFPAPLRSRFGEVLKVHALRREILMTVLTNELVNRMGVTFVSRLRRELGAGVEEVVAA